jgi:small-conductance mechanosensitive channel
MQPTKDAWYSAYKNFLHVAYLLTFLVVVVGWMYITKNEAVANLGVWPLLIMVIAAAVWYYLANLFKKRDPRATSRGYLLLTILLILNLFSFNIIGVLFLLFFFYLIYRASKVPVASVM